MGAYPSFSIERMYSPRGMRAPVNGEVPNSLRADAVPASVAESFHVDSCAFRFGCHGDRVRDRRHQSRERRVTGQIGRHRDGDVVRLDVPLRFGQCRYLRDLGLRPASLGRSPDEPPGGAQDEDRRDPHRNRSPQSGLRADACNAR